MHQVLSILRLGKQRRRQQQLQRRQQQLPPPRLKQARLQRQQVAYCLFKQKKKICL